MSETAGDRLARLLALVPWLMAHDGISLEESAGHFGVTVEQLESDLWLLVVCGVPGYGPDQLVDIDFWDDGIHVIDPQTLSRPLRLTGDEAMTLLIALRMLAQVPGVHDRRAVLTAAAKIESASELAGTQRFVDVTVGVSPEIASAIDDALAAKSPLLLEYAAATTDEVTTRVVRPIRLLTVDGVVYLEAFCSLAGADRTFRLDRVMTAGPGSWPEQADHSESAEPRVQAPIRVELEVESSARWIIDVHDATVLSESERGTVIELAVLDLAWASRLVLSLHGAARVRQPAELAQSVAAAAGAALAAYATS